MTTIERPFLSLADNLSIPLEAVTQTFAILAKRGVGKTYTASVLVEELLGAGQQVVVIDPLDVWWGLRTNAAGDGPGLAIAVLGGTQGDVPLEADQGRTVADIVVDQRIPAVLSIRHLSKAGQRRFVADFAERLYEKKGEPGNRSPLHLVIDEADAFVPQRVMGETARVMGAVDDLVRRGRSSGIGVTLITQRASVIHKDVLTQIEVLIALRTVSPQDRKAIETWIDAHDPTDRVAEIMASLASLAIGEAWVWSPGWLDVLERVRIRRRRTFDSSSTPEVNGEPVVPAGRATIDLAGIRAILAPPPVEAPPAGPKRSWSRRPGDRVVATTVEKDVPQIPNDSSPLVEERIATLERRLDALVQEIRMRSPEGIVSHSGSEEPTNPPAPPLSTVTQQTSTPLRRATSGSEARLRTGERRIVEALARFHPMAMTAPQVGAFARLAHAGGTFSAYVTTLLGQGLIGRDGAGRLLITREGLDLLGANRPSRPTNAVEVVSLWRNRLPAGTVRLLEALASDPRRVWSREQLADQVGLTASGGTFGAGIGMLRNLDLADARGPTIRAGSALLIVDQDEQAREVRP